jgi:hypothetical protein
VFAFPKSRTYLNSRFKFLDLNESSGKVIQPAQCLEPVQKVLLQKFVYIVLVRKQLLTREKMLYPIAARISHFRSKVACEMWLIERSASSAGFEYLAQILSQNAGLVHLLETSCGELCVRNRPSGRQDSMSHLIDEVVFC